MNNPQYDIIGTERVKEEADAQTTHRQRKDSADSSRT